MALPLLQLLNITIDEGGDALFTLENSPPVVRHHGILKRIEHPNLIGSEIETFLAEVGTVSQRETFFNTGTVTFVFEIRGVARFRGHWYKNEHRIGAIFRRILYKIPDVVKLGISIGSKGFPSDPGIHLIAGSVRSGRSTTLAALIDEINQAMPITICIIHTGMHPIHIHKKGLITDIIIGKDAKCIKEAIEFAVISSEADCIAIDGIYGRDALEALLFAARSGIYCYATVFGQSVEEVIQNILCEWPYPERKNILASLSGNLNWILCQALLPYAYGRGRVLASELLYCTQEVKTLIEIDRLDVIRKMFSADYSDGLNISMENSLQRMYKKRYISLETINHFLGAYTNEKRLKEVVMGGGER